MGLCHSYSFLINVVCCEEQLDGVIFKPEYSGEPTTTRIIKNKYTLFKHHIYYLWGISHSILLKVHSFLFPDNLFINYLSQA